MRIDLIYTISVIQQLLLRVFHDPSLVPSGPYNFFTILTPPIIARFFPSHSYNICSFSPPPHLFLPCSPTPYHPCLAFPSDAINGAVTWYIPSPYHLFNSPPLPRHNTNTCTSPPITITPLPPIALPHHNTIASPPTL